MDSYDDNLYVFIQTIIDQKDKIVCDTYKIKTCELLSRTLLYHNKEKNLQDNLKIIQWNKKKYM